MNYTHIIFDIDGTLLDTEYAVLHSLQKTIRQVTGADMACEQLIFALGIPGEEALKQLSIPDIPQTHKLWIRYLNELHDTVRLFDGIEPVLDTLSRHGLHLGIVTSQRRFHYQGDLGSQPIARHFQTVVCSDDTKEHKPFPEPLLYYQKQAGAAPEQMLYVGDSKYDMACAEAAHVDFALAGWGSRGRVDASCVLHTPADLLKKAGCPA